MSGYGQTEDSQLQDPGEQNQRSQIQHLNKIRQQISEIRTKGRVQLNRKRRLTALRASVVEYASLLQAYLRDERLQDEDGDEALWHERDIATYHVPPPDKSELDLDRFEIVSWPSTEPVTITGVVELLQIGVEYPMEFEIEARSSVHGQQTFTVTRNGAPTEKALMASVAELDSFRRSVGLGLQLEEKSQNLEI